MTGKRPIEDKSPLSPGAFALSAFLVPALLLCCYFNVFTSPFTLDDNHLIVENRQIRDITNLKEIHDCAPSRPLLMLSYAVNYHFGGLNPFGYHLGNVLIHALASISVLIVSMYLLAFFGKDFTPPLAALPGLAASFFFALHPVFTEAITYVGGRSSSQSAFFYLLAFIFFIKAMARRGLYTKSKTTKVFFLFLSLLCYIFSMATKETGATLPLVLAFFCLLLPKGQKARPMLLTIPFYILLALLLLLRWLRTGAMLEKDPGFLFENTRLDYMLTQLQVVPLYYLNKLFLPVGLNIDIYFPIVKNFFTVGGAASVALLFFLALLCLRLGKKSLLPVFGLGWFFIALLPTASFIPIMDVAVERSVYLPGAGFALFVSFLISQGKKVFPVVLCLAAILGLFGVETIKRNHLYSDEFKLWTDVLEKAPRKARSHYAMGHLYERRNDVDLSMLEFSRALELDPGYADAWYSLGLVYFKKGIFLKSKTSYWNAIFLRPDKQAKYYSGYGTALHELGEFKEAEDAYLEALRIDPGFLPARTNLAKLCVKLQRYKEAEALYLQILQRTPDHKPSFLDLCVVYILSGRHEEARKAIEEGLRRYPGDQKLEELRRAVL